MKKHLANIITGSRIVGAGILLCFDDFTPQYMIVYCLCAFTDLIDGPIARKTGSSSILGAFLDTMGDGLVSISMLKIFLIKRMIPGWMIIWLVAVISLFFVAAGYSKFKFNKFYVPHTLVDKLLGGVTYTMPFAVQIIDPMIWMWIEGIVLTVASVETMAIQIKSETAKDFVPSVFHVNR